MNWYRQAQLSSGAYETEAQPARLRQHLNIQKTPFGHAIIVPQDQKQIQELYKGVHLTPDKNLAAMYANGKATKKDPPVVIAIDTSFMRKELDVDALENKSVEWFIGDIKPEIEKILNSGQSDEMIREAIMNYLDKNKDGIESQETEIIDDIIMQNARMYPIEATINYLEKIGENNIINVIREIINGNIPNEIRIKVEAQFRIMHDIFLTNVKEIYRVSWVNISDLETGLWDMSEEELEERGYHKDEKTDKIYDEEGREVKDYEDWEYGNAFQYQKIWENRQLSLWPHLEEINYHGTTWNRAKSAYPEVFKKTKK